MGRFAAWKYTVVHQKQRPRKNPHEIEAELQRLSASAWDLRAKLEGISVDCFNLILSDHGTHSQQPFYIDPRSLPVDARKERLDQFRQYGLSIAGVEEWFFPLRRPPGIDRLVDENNNILHVLENDRLKELESLCRLFEAVAEEVSRKKEAPNGSRGLGKGRNYKIDNLIRLIGKIVSYKKRPFSHILPIARKIHEWANPGEIMGLDWGLRPFERIKPMLKALKWREVFKEEIGKKKYTEVGWPIWVNDNMLGFRKLDWELNQTMDSSISIE
jgi:hypothetical protein